MFGFVWFCFFKHRHYVSLSAPHNFGLVSLLYLTEWCCPRGFGLSGSAKEIDVCSKEAKPLLVFHCQASHGKATKTGGGVISKFLMPWGQWLWGFCFVRSTQTPTRLDLGMSWALQATPEDTESCALNTESAKPQLSIWKIGTFVSAPTSLCAKWGLFMLVACCEV